MTHTSLIPCRLKLSRTPVSGTNPDGTGLWVRTQKELLVATPDMEFRLDGLAFNTPDGHATWHSLSPKPPFLLCWQQLAADDCLVTLFAEDDRTLRQVAAFFPLELSKLYAFHRHIIFHTIPSDVQRWLLPARCVKEPQNV